MHPVLSSSYAKGWELSVQLFEETQTRKRKSRKTALIKLMASSFLLLMSYTTFAQLPTQTIRGRVIDQESQTPVIGANVVITSLEPIKGNSTDEKGEFRLDNVPVGRHHLKISSIGYEETSIPELLIGSGKEVVITIRLTESLVKMEELVIKALADKSKPNNDLAVVSARSFTVEETKQYAASVNDPARMALSFAGVAANDDGTNEIVIRGNSPRGLLWRIEGVEVPNPNHFGDEGASGGGISMLSVNMLNNSDFFTGAFPAEYGNAASGVFDIKLRNGNNEKREYAFQAGMLGIDFATEGPFAKQSNASYLINYRYSTLGILNAMGIKITGDAITNFQDLSYKFHVPTKKAGVFSFWGLGGLSSQQVDDAFEKEDFHYNMGVTGLSHIFFFSDKTYLESILTYSKSKNLFIDEEERNKYFNNETYINAALRGSFLLNHKFNARHTLRTGLIISQLGFDFFEATTFRDTTRTNVDTEGNSQLWQAYAQWKHRINERLTLNTGLHYMYLALNRNSSLEPRLGLQWALAPGQSLSVGFGIHSRLDPLSNYFALYQTGPDSYQQPNKNLEFSKSRHYVLGYDHSLTNDLHMRLEAYYQDLYDIPIGISENNENPWYATYSSINYEGGILDFPLANNGTGRNYGLELTLEKLFTKNYYFLLTSSLFESKYTPFDGKEYNTRFNSNYVMNILAGKEFKIGKNKTNSLGINIRAILTGGNRVTPIDLEKSRELGRPVMVWDRRYAERAGNYFRVDLRISYRINKPKFSSVVSLDIQNTTNRQNVFSTEYNAQTQQITYSYQLGLIPVLNYRIEF